MRTCLECSTSIEHKHKLAKFCSALCKDANWQARNPERMALAAAKFRKTEKSKTYRQENQDKIHEQMKAWKLANVERKQELDRQYHQSKQGDPEYLAKRRFHEANRRARKAQATPPWLSEQQKQDIKDFYLKCPKDHEVDHVIPLKSKIVCGLHVAWNLQYLPASLNRAKSNKVEQ